MATQPTFTLFVLSALILCVAGFLYSGSVSKGRGINYCNWCGSTSNTPFNANTISRCVLNLPDITNITNSLFQCECKEGYTGDGITCNDFDECKVRADNCDNNAICTNKLGSWSCECKDGWRGDGVHCENVDECAINNGGCPQRCVNTPGSFVCACYSGYIERDPSIPGVHCSADGS